MPQPVQPPRRGGPPPFPGAVPPQRGPAYPPRPGGPVHPAPPPPRGPGYYPPPGPAAAPPPPPYLATAPTVPHELPRRRRFPWKIALGVAAVVFVLLTKPAIIVQTLTTPIALLIVAAIVGGMLLLRLLLSRLPVPAPARAATMGVAWLVLAYLLVWPFYADYVVPTPVSQAAPPVAAPASPSAGEPAAPAQTGSFSGLDGHRGSGEASLVRVADGSYVVRLAGVDIGSGPDLRGYLVPGAGQESPGDGAVDLGRLSNSIRGDLNLPVPAGTAIEAGQPYTVLVWCRAFQVPVAGATIT